MALSASCRVDISTRPMRRDFPAGSVMISAESTVPKGANRSVSCWAENKGGSPSTISLVPTVSSLVGDSNGEKAKLLQSKNQGGELGRIQTAHNEVSTTASAATTPLRPSPR